MGTAVVFTASCGRCGAWSDAGDVRCRHCGTTHAPTVDAASAAPLLNGTVPAPLYRSLPAVLVDLLVPLGLIAAAVPTATPGGVRLLLLLLGLTAGASCLVSHGHSGRWLGGLICRTRTVDALTATPLGTPALLLRLAARAGRGLTCVDLVNGRDPLQAVFVPLAPLAIASAEPSAAAASANAASPAAGPAAVPAAAPAASPVAVPVAVPAAAAATFGGPLTLLLDTGQRATLSGGLLIGRNPSNPDGAVQHELLALPDLSRTLSKTHALIEWAAGEIWVTDLGSTNGTALLGPADARTAVPLGVRTVVPEHCSLALGDRSLGFAKPVRTTA